MLLRSLVRNFDVGDVEGQARRGDEVPAEGNDGGLIADAPDATLSHLGYEDWT